MKAILIILLGCVTSGLLVAAVMLFAGQTQTNGWDNQMRRINEEQQASFEGKL